MYELHLTGSREPISITATQKMKLDTLLETGDRSAFVDIADNKFKISAVKSIRKVGYATPTNKKQNDDGYYKALEEHRKIKELPPVKRAERTATFEMCWQAFNGKPVPDEIMQKVIKLQKAYFTKHPNRTAVTPLLFKEILDNNTKRHGKNQDMMITMALNLAQLASDFTRELDK